MATLDKAIQERLAVLKRTASLPDSQKPERVTTPAIQRSLQQAGILDQSGNQRTLVKAA